MYTLQFDGLFRSFTHPSDPHQRCGFMCYGWIVMRQGVIVAHGHGGCARSDDATSIAAEYMALIEGLEALSDMGITTEPITIQGDAKTIIDQMQGFAAVISPHIKPFFRHVRRLTRPFQRLQWKWTPRKFNRAADALTRRAIEQIFSCHDCDRLASDLMHTSRKARSRLVPLVSLRVHQSIPSGLA